MPSVDEKRPNEIKLKNNFRCYAAQIEIDAHRMSPLVSTAKEETLPAHK